MGRLVFISCKVFVICVAMIAFVAVGFAHRSERPALTPELAEYLAAGGLLSDICGTADGRGGALVQTCEACRLTDGFGYATDGRSNAPERIAKVYVFNFIAKRLAESGRLDTVRLARAPPQA